MTTSPEEIKAQQQQIRDLSAHIRAHKQHVPQGANDMSDGLGIHKALCNIKGILAKHGGITKDRNAPMGYKFRGIEDFDEVLCGITADEQVVMYPRVISKEIFHGTTARGSYQSHVLLEVEWTFVCAKDGSRQTCSVMGEAMDTQDKACNKAVQASRKYALLTILQVPTSGDDTEAYYEPAQQHELPRVARGTEAHEVVVVNDTEAKIAATQTEALRKARAAKAPKVKAPVVSPEERAAKDRALDELDEGKKRFDRLLAEGRVALEEAPLDTSDAVVDVQVALTEKVKVADDYSALFAIWQDADKMPEPTRGVIGDHVTQRTMKLLATAPDLATMRGSKGLIQALGSPEVLVSLYNDRFQAFRQAAT